MLGLWQVRALHNRLSVVMEVSTERRSRAYGAYLVVDQFSSYWLTTFLFEVKKVRRIVDLPL